MKPTDVTDVMNQLGGATRDLHGWNWGPLRIQSGGGIAGNSAQYWITCPGAHDDFPSKGPYSTKKQLRNALRELIVWALQFGDGLLKIAEMHAVKQSEDT